MQEQARDHQPRLAVLVEGHEPGRPGLPVVRPGRRRRTCVKRPHSTGKSNQHFMLPAAHWASRKTGNAASKKPLPTAAWGRSGCLGSRLPGLLSCCHFSTPPLRTTTASSPQSTVHSPEATVCEHSIRGSKSPPRESRPTIIGAKTPILDPSGSPHCLPCQGHRRLQKPAWESPIASHHWPVDAQVVCWRHLAAPGRPLSADFSRVCPLHSRFPGPRLPCFFACFQSQLAAGGRPRLT